jgi:hypothetical protein
VEGGSVGFAKINGRMYTGSSPKIEQDGKPSWTGILRLSGKFLADSKLLTNTWYEKGVFTDAPVNAAMVEICAANGNVALKFGSSWREDMKRIAAKGYNAVFIDFAGGYRYPSHPELAVKGAWSVEDVTQALDVAREEGLEPIPCMDFTAPRNSWLGAKNLPAASKASLDFCCDLIKDLEQVFGSARYFRIKTDGLPDETVNALNDAIVNRGYGSCPWSLKGGSVAANFNAETQSNAEKK